MADVQSEKSLDDFFAKRDKKKKKEKGKGKETTTGPATAAMKKMKKEKEKSAKNENQDDQVEKVTDAAFAAVRGELFVSYRCRVRFGYQNGIRASGSVDKRDFTLYYVRFECHECTFYLHD